MARPRKEIKKEEFEKLCALQCTQKEILFFYDITDKTLNSWCKRTYSGMSFSDVYEQKRVFGKISLRRYQFQLAEKNAAMAIFLGKQYLEQSDMPEENTAKADFEDLNPLADLLKEDKKDE